MIVEQIIIDGDSEAYKKIHSADTYYAFKISPPSHSAPSLPPVSGSLFLKKYIYNGTINPTWLILLFFLFYRARDICSSRNEQNAWGEIERMIYLFLFFIPPSLLPRWSKKKKNLPPKIGVFRIVSSI